MSACFGAIDISVILFLEVFKIELSVHPILGIVVVFIELIFFEIEITRLYLSNFTLRGAITDLIIIQIDGPMSFSLRHHLPWITS